MKKIKGYSLIEAVVAVTIIAIISVAAFEVFRYCRRFTVGAELRLMAANFVRESMESYYWDPNLGITSGWEDAEALPQGMEFGSRLGNDYGGTRQYRVRNDNETAPDYRIIDVSVGWNF